MNQTPTKNWSYPLKKHWNFNYIVKLLSLLYSINSHIKINVNLELQNVINKEFHPFTTLIDIGDVIKHGKKVFDHYLFFIELGFSTLTRIKSSLWDHGTPSKTPIILIPSIHLNVIVQGDHQCPTI